MGVDSSTQSCKVELRSLDDGARLAHASAPHPPTTPPVSEQDPRAWWDAFVTAAQAALAKAPTGTRVRAISVDAQCHGLVLLDDTGTPLRPAKLWNDTTSAAEAMSLVEQVGADRFAHDCGTVPTSAFTISKLAWVARHEPELLERVTRILVPTNYLTFRLTGRAVTDRSDASGTGYFAIRTGHWLHEYLKIATDLDLTAALPEVLDPAEPAGTIRPEVATALRLDPDVLVGPGCGDQHAGAMGLGAAPGDVVVSIGTSGVVYQPTSEPVADPTGWVSGTADATGGYLPLVCTLNAAKVTDTTAGWLGVDVADLSELALASTSSDSGLTFAPFLDGERTPNRPDAHGALHGLTTTTTREQLAQAAFDGVVLGLLIGWRRMTECGLRRTGRLLVTGGAARAAAYRQAVADLFEDTVLVPDAGESSARGACVQAAAVAQGCPILTVVRAWAPPATVGAEPSPRDTAPLIERYQTLSEWRALDA